MNLNHEVETTIIDRSDAEGMAAIPSPGLVDEKAVITLSADKMVAHIKFIPAAGGNLLNVHNIINILKQENVIYGIKKEMLIYLANNSEKAYNRNILIAEGTMPVNGADGSLTVHFPVMRDKTPKILENGQVDHKQINRPNIVIKGDLLVTRKMATSGRPGRNVCGEPVNSKPGRERIIPAGKLTDLSEDNLTLYSAADGYVEIIDGRVTVLRVLEINGDVGTSTGHIDFPGDVIIKGNIISTYNVTAGGSIHVGGCVEASHIFAGGDVIISQGVKGFSSKGVPDCYITARGNITSKFIENAVVNAMGTIQTNSIVHSIVTSNDVIEVKGKHGNIIGGKISALRSIACYNVGNDIVNMSTVLEVGVTMEIREKYLQLKKQLDKLNIEINKTKEILTELSYEILTAKQVRRKYTLEQQIVALEDEAYPIIKDLRVIREMMKDANSGTIHVSKSFYPPVTVSIGSITRIYDIPQKNITFKYVDGEIETGNCEYKFKM